MLTTEEGSQGPKWTQTPQDIPRALLAPLLLSLTKLDPHCQMAIHDAKSL